MKNKFKILLNSKRSVTSENVDEYMLCELRREDRNILPSVYNNEFSLTDQFIEERNKSLKFCLYGIVESAYADCTNITLEISTNNNDIIYYRDKNGFTATTFNIVTIPLSSGDTLSKNVFSKAKSYYHFLFEVDESLLVRNSDGILENKSFNIKVNDLTKNLIDEFNVPFLYYDENGERLNFGEEFADIQNNGTVLEINNDYPFLYDRHWVKYNLTPNKLRTVSMPNLSIIKVSEGVSSGNLLVDVSLDFPSKAGNESVDIVLTQSATFSQPNPDYTFTAQTLNWEIGEQIKQFNIGIINDLYVESVEDFITLKIDNPQNVIVNPERESILVQIIDDDVKSKVTFKTNQLTITEGNFSIPIEIILSTPMLIDNQTVRVLVDSNLTTADAVNDYMINPISSPTQSYKDITFAVGDTGATFYIDFLEDRNYELDKLLVLRLESLSQNQNLEVGSPPNEMMTITIKDSLITKYSRFVLPINSYIGDGLYCPIRRTSDAETYDFFLSQSHYSAMRKDMRYEIFVYNKGVPVYSGSTKVLYNQIVFKKGYSAHPETIYIDLPSNDSFNAQGKYYEKSKYDIFIYPVQFYDFLLSPNYSMIDCERNQLNNVGFQMNVDAGNIGEKNYYATTKMLDIKIGLDASDECLVPSTTYPFNLSLATEASINGVVFLPNWNYAGFNILFSNLPYTSVSYVLSDKRISYKCGTHIINSSIIESTLPFGFDYIQDPIQEKYITLDFGKIAIQAGISVGIIKLKEATITDLTNSSGFFTSSSANNDTSNKLRLKITNIGERDVVVSGQTLFAGSSTIIDNFNNRLWNNYSIDLPSNYLYNSTSQTYERALYKISFENIYFYTINNTRVNSVPRSVEIATVNLTANTVSNGIPYYALRSIHRNIQGPLNCNPSTMVYGNYALKGMLITNSPFTNFVNLISKTFQPITSDFVETCANVIPHKKL